MTTPIRRLAITGLLVGAMFFHSDAGAYTWHARNVAPSYLPATGHYYQIWDAQIADGEFFSWADAVQFAASLKYNGIDGYAATIDTEPEAQMLQDYNELRSPGLTGALLTQGVWKWMTGPETGQPVVFRRTAAYAVSQCAPYAQTITVWGGTWYLTPYSGNYNRGLGPPSSCILPSVLVEFPSSVVPTSAPTWGRLKIFYR